MSAPRPVKEADKKDEKKDQQIVEKLVELPSKFEWKAKEHTSGPFTAELI